jgi:hypothetical protein
MFFVSFYVVMEAYGCTIANLFLVLICTCMYSTKFTLERINLFILISKVAKNIFLTRHGKYKINLDRKN